MCILLGCVYTIRVCGVCILLGCVLQECAKVVPENIQKYFQKIDLKFKNILGMVMMRCDSTHPPSNVLYCSINLLMKRIIQLLLLTSMCLTGKGNVI